MSGTTNSGLDFTAGDLVISVVGDGNGSGDYTDGQATPITLEEVTTAGSIVGQMVLPQTTTEVDGTTEYAISAEMGSSSEGDLQLAANGKSLVIGGYGVNAVSYNDGDEGYGDTALAQTSSLTDGPHVAIPRVIADIGANGTVDTSTALYNVYNTNNIRSVATVDGTSFWVSGQGVAGDDTQGVFYAEDGANSATTINDSTDTREAEIINGALYVSTDSTQGNGGTSNISVYSTLPTSATNGTVLPGIDGKLTLTAAQENAVNAADVGSSVNLSPEGYFFANSSTLYIADGGDPKEGGLGDGGLQKWSDVNGTWQLDYTLSSGLDLVPDTASSGTTGLIELTGTVVNGVVDLYATNETIGDLDQTYLYGIQDNLSATTLPTDESFQVLDTAAPDTTIRGISFAPTEDMVTPTSVTVTSGVTSSGFTVTSGSNVTVELGGIVSGLTVASGGFVTISGGATDYDSTIAHGGSETVLGSATGDVVEGTQLVSAATAVVTDETVYNGGQVDLFLKGAVGEDITLENGGILAISGNAYGSNTTLLSGGTVILESAKATLSGDLVFSGTGELQETAISDAGYGAGALISGFGAGDVIDLTSVGSGATLATSVMSGDTVATVTDGATILSFTFAGDISGLVLTSDGTGGSEIVVSGGTGTTVSGGSTMSGLVVSSGAPVSVTGDSTIVSATILSGGTVLDLGVDSGSVIEAGGTEIVSGVADGDQVYGYQLVSAAGAITNGETVYNGGSIDLYLKGGVVSSTVVESGGEVNISGNAIVDDIVLDGGAVLETQSPKSNISGSVVFSGAATIAETDIISAGYGVSATISGWQSGDVIDIGSYADSATTISSAVVSGNTEVTLTDDQLTDGTTSQTFTFAGSSYTSNSFVLQADSSGNAELTNLSSAVVSSGGSSTTSGGSSTTSGGSSTTSGGSSTTSSSSTTSGSSSITSGGSTTGVIVSGGSPVIISGTTSASVVPAGGTAVVISGGVAVDFTVSSGGNLVVSTGGIVSGAVLQAGGRTTVGSLGSATELAGSATINVSNSVLSATLNSGSDLSTTGSAVISGPATGAATVDAGAGSTTVNAGAGTVSVGGSAGGSLDFVGGTGAATVGGAGFGTVTLYGGSGSGSSLLIGGTGNALEVGANVSSGSAEFVAGSGNSTLNGGTGTQAQSYFTNPLGNSGTVTVQMNDGASTMVGGSGAATVTAGTGSDVFGFVKGHAGGSETIVGFNSSDTLAFDGYGYSLGNAPAETVVNGNDVMTLGDGTTITFEGVDHKLF